MIDHNCDHDWIYANVNCNFQDVPNHVLGGWSCHVHHGDPGSNGSGEWVDFSWSSWDSIKRMTKLPKCTLQISTVVIVLIINVGQ